MQVCYERTFPSSKHVDLSGDDTDSAGEGNLSTMSTTQPCGTDLSVSRPEALSSVIPLPKSRSKPSTKLLGTA